MSEQSIKSKVPTGVVTLFFTDIVRSSQLWEEHGDRFIPVLQAHDAILRDAITRFHGHEVKSEGDAFMVAFSDPVDALNCSIYAQTALSRYPWPTDIGQPRVRVGLHTGEPFVFQDDYFGPVVNRAAYVCKAAHGGQILLTEETLRAIGERADAAIEFHDLGELRLKDMGLPQRLSEVRHPALNVGSFPPLRTLDSQPNNLPIHRTSFVGRAREIEAIAGFLAQGDKAVLTLTGPGGIGKTRLSLQVAAATADWFPDGVYYVKLVEARDVVGAAVEIASVMSIPLDPDRPPLPQVCEWLADRQCLLVLDDANTLPHADRLIRELLTGTTRLRCLATSRESLQISEGDELALAGLATVPQAAHPDGALVRVEEAVVTEGRAEAARRELAKSEAGRLFIERATAVNPNLRLSPAEMEAAVQLLKQLDGTPVSIERAAQMMDRVPPSVVLEWLNQRLEPDRVPARSPGVQKFRSIVRGAAQKVSDQIEGFPRTLEVNLGRMLQGVADYAAERRDEKQAVSLGQETLRFTQQAGDKAGMAAALRQLAQVRWKQGDRQSAIAMLTASAQLYRESDPERCPEVQSELERAREQLERIEGAVPVAQTLDTVVAIALEERPRGG